MPVEFSGVVDEHLAVREKAGLFDVSHMGEFFLEGAGAEGLLQHLTPNDVSKLALGQAQYSALTTENGCFVDDVLVYRMDDERYMVVVNAANIDKDFAWITSHGDGVEGVTLTNASDDYALLAVQGPEALAILDPLTDLDLTQMKYYRFAEGEVLGEAVTVSRTGYTGEDGFEVMVPAGKAEELAAGLLERGKDYGLRPVGLAARDTLRLEAKMALYGNDIDDEHTVLEADLGWIVKWKKGDFIGREALERQKERGVARKLVGFEMVDRGIARHGYPVFVGGEPSEIVTSGTYAPYLKKSIGLAYLPIDASEEGSEFEIEIRGRRAKARVVPTPFYKREKKA
jgi:aminomethyltransferase